MQIVFHSSLPRSGSTLLQNVLAQNPRFYCSPTSAMGTLLFAARKVFTETNEFRSQDTRTMRAGWAGFCRGGLLGWYYGITDKPVAIDKSRGWLGYWEWFKGFYPEAKLICCVRDLRGILSSMEKRHRKMMFLHDPQEQVDKLAMTTIESRVHTWLRTAPFGLALERLRDALVKGNDKDFFFVVYERFMEEPLATLADLYAYLGEEPFAHDLGNIAQVVNENDNWHGIYGDHRIKNQWSPVVPDWDKVIGKSICDAVLRNQGWFYNRFYK